MNNMGWVITQPFYKNNGGALYANKYIVSKRNAK
jgi:hypothetical protein